MEKGPQTIRRIGARRGNERITKALAGKFICNLDESLLVPVTITTRATVFAIRKAVVKNTNRAGR